MVVIISTAEQAQQAIVSQNIIKKQFEIQKI